MWGSSVNVVRVTSDDAHRPPFDQSRIATLPRPLTRLEVLPQAGSTNALVADRARAGEPEGLVLVADHQTAGRGRLDRRWETPPGAALTFSVLLRPVAVPAPSWPWLPLLTGVAVAEAVTATAGVACGLKWPNDVLVGERKLGGLLVERVDTPDGPVAVVGIGLNVGTGPDELPVPTATSLRVERPDTTVGREELLASVLGRFADRYLRWSDPGLDGTGHGADELAAAYRRSCTTLGRQVTVHLPGGRTRVGVAEDVEDDGALRVRTDEGPLVVHSGDVVHVRSGGPAA